ncbi:hypothetical protein NPIL_309741 [Nephila pilipes]|uniref:Uncharacterized protein n=1 Tax=Nephila pilipes TaxID=299642 RepID=A0A8X6UHU3_NEPPI|nr:hypothetical protein NPIL_309741 [Nephila pilipes]
MNPKNGRQKGLQIPKNLFISFLLGKRKHQVRNLTNLWRKKISKKKCFKCGSTSGNSYDPSKNCYHPVNIFVVCWKKSEKVYCLVLAKTLE